MNTPPYHALVIALGSSGDLHPMLAIAGELQQRGRRVTFFVNEHFAPIPRRFGLTCTVMGSADEYSRVTLNPDLWHPTRGGATVMQQAVVPSLRQTIDLIAQHVAEGPTVVVSTPVAMGARIARDKFAMPLASINFAPIAYLSVAHPPRMPTGQISPKLPMWMKRSIFSLIERWMTDPMIAPDLNALRAEMGLSPVRNVFTRWWQSPDLTISMFPKWFAAPAPDWPAHHTQAGFHLFDEREQTQTLPENIDAFLRAGPAPIVFTPGSAMRFGQRFFSTAVEAVHVLGRRAIFLTRYPEQLPPSLPRTVAHFDYVPLSLLLPRCAALVSHGGIGTVAQGLAAGIPQVVMAMAHDQFDNAARLEALRVGSMLRREKFSTSRLVKILSKLLNDPEMPSRCADLKARFNPARDIASACDAIDDLAQRSFGHLKPHPIS